MHSSNDAAQQPSLNHANLFSFAPAQRAGRRASPAPQAPRSAAPRRTGLLDSPTTKTKRSADQSLNLRASFEKLQASLDKAFPEQARAI